MAFLILGGPVQAGEILDRIRESGALRCAVEAGRAGFAEQRDDGSWFGFDIDLCRAVAAAALDREDALEVLALPAEAAKDALLAGELDLLARGPSARGFGASPGPRFVTHTLINGQGLLVPLAAEVGNALSLAGQAVCVGPEAALSDNLARFGQTSSIELTPLERPDRAALAKALLAGECQAISLGRLELAALRREELGEPADFEILPDVLSRQQLGPYVAPGDREWLSLVRWTVFALITAEERGISRENAEGLRRKSKDSRVRRLLGVTPGLGAGLGLDDAWAYRAIRAVGNYGELYERHLGLETPLGLERGPNALWLSGGLLHAPPFR